MPRILLTDATVWAGVTCAPRPGWLLLDDDRIAGVGHAAPPAADTVLALPGAHILPGFVDSHVHLTATAWQSRGHDGGHWRGIAAALRSVRDAAAADPTSPWLLFWNARPFSWPERRLPSAAELDAAAPGRRVLISGLDLHRGAASSAALDGVAGFDRADLVRDRRGRATGELWERAYGAVLARALADTEEYVAVEDLVRGQLDRCLTLGITHAHEAYVPPHQHDRMLRLAAPAAPRLSWAIGSDEGLLSPVPPPDVAPGGPYGAATREVKVFLDGGDRCALCLPAHALGQLTVRTIRQAIAARHPGPLRDAMGRRSRLVHGQLHLSDLRYDDRALADTLAGYASAGIRVRLHALGNRAVRQAADALVTVGAPAGAAVIDHLTLLDDATTQRVAASGARAAYQPGFLESFGPQITQSGADRYLSLLAGRNLLDAGVPLALASDHPAGPLDPLANMRAAVLRTLPDGSRVQAAQALTPTEAVRAMTTTAAASLGAPGAGGIAPGEAADLAICDGEPFAAATRVVRTWINGREVWRG